MTEEKFQELYDRAQNESKGGQLLSYFAKLVEQATLERAAKDLRELSEANAKAAEETISSDNETWHEHAALVYSRSASSILKLKDSND